MSVISQSGNDSGSMSNYGCFAKRFVCDVMVYSRFQLKLSSRARHSTRLSPGTTPGKTTPEMLFVMLFVMFFLMLFVMLFVMFFCCS